MDGQRPPRSVRPLAQQQSPRSPAPPYSDPVNLPRSPPANYDPRSTANVSFQTTERGDRTAALDAHRQHHLPSAYQHQPHLSYSGDPESSEYADASRVSRKKSLVRPDREKIEPGHRQWHYRTHVAQLEQEGNARVGFMPSCQCHFLDYTL